MKTTQKEKVKKELLLHGIVTRNWALSNFISRLSGYILELNGEGFEIVGTMVNGDYVYKLIDKPKTTQTVVERDELGHITKVYEKQV